MIGHMKSDYRMERNHFFGKEGDRINAIHPACEFNIRKLIPAFFLPILEWFLFGKRCSGKSRGELAIPSIAA